MEKTTFTQTMEFFSNLWIKSRSVKLNQNFCLNKLSGFLYGISLSGENEELKFHIICQKFLANFVQALRAICGMFKIKKRLTRSSKKNTSETKFWIRNSWAQNKNYSWLNLIWGKFNIIWFFTYLII